MRILIAFCLAFCLANVAHATPENPSITFEELYRYGKEEYSMKNWIECVGFMRRALEDFEYFRSELLACREKCAAEEASRSIEAVESHYERAMAAAYAQTQQALCLLRCRGERFTSERPPLRNANVFDEFVARRPFHYLQLCFFKLGDVENAVAAAYTYLVAHPNDAEALANVRFWFEQAEFESSMLVDLLRPPYEIDYMSGIEAYEAKNWRSCVSRLESGAQAWLAELTSLRRGCDDALDWSSLQNDNPEIEIVTSSAYISVLRCRRGCVERLSIVNGRRIQNLLASIYEHVHICYYNLNQGRQATTAVANAQLLASANVALMRTNRLFYTQKYENRPELFVPSPHIVAFVRRHALEKRFLDFVDERFRYVDGELPTENVGDRLPFDLNVDISDRFDYSLLTEPLLEAGECRVLFVASLLGDGGRRSIAYSTQLETELRHRISKRFGQRPQRGVARCGLVDASPIRCERGALIIISLDRHRCGELASSNVGCAIVHCVE